jgi:hypothetical protein
MLYIPSQSLTLSEYVQALATWEEFAHSLPIWARPFAQCLTFYDIALWEIETDILLLDEAV